jgi:hypothetical protein
MEQSGDAPVVARLILGDLLGHYRKLAGITGVAAARAIGAEGSTKISRMESGQVPSDPDDVSELLSLYRVTDDQERERALDLARVSGQPGWWHAWARRGPPDPLRHILEIEAAATHLTCYDPLAVPAVLQIPEYAAALTSSSPFRRPAPWRGGMSIEMLHRRHELLRRRPRPTPVLAVLDEAVLRRAPGGSPPILSQQITELINAGGPGGVAVQIVPAGCPDTLAAAGPYTIARLPGGLPDVVIIEHLTTLTMVRDPGEVDYYKQLRDRLAFRALTPRDSAERLRAILRALQRGEREVPPGREPGA